MKYLFIILCIFCLGNNGQCQVSPTTLFIIDSIPVLVTPDQWDKILQEDIADKYVLVDRDSITALGWKKIEAIIYIFTKAYRNRPDSIKQIPSTKQMRLLDTVWVYHNNIYTGRYRNYFADGQLQEEGYILNGKRTGEAITYYKKGIKKSLVYFGDDGRIIKSVSYYKNGAVFKVLEGLRDGHVKSSAYYNNGQLQQELRKGPYSKKDTLIQYFSDGRIKKLVTGYNGDFAIEKKRWYLNNYTYNFYSHINAHDLKEANRDLYKIKELGIDSVETLLKEGALLMLEFRFERAIRIYDSVLKIEPLTREAFIQRAIARIKLTKYKAVPLNEITEEPILLDDMKKMPAGEQEKVCTDVLMADYLDTYFELSFSGIPAAIIVFCGEQQNTLHQ